MISQELGYIFSEAVKFTKKYRHEYISVEHLFLALLEHSCCPLPHLLLT